MQQQVEMVTNIGVVGVWLTSIATNILPVLVSLATFIWFLIRIYETETVQKLLKKKKK